jgi:amino acid transporter
MSTRWTVDSPAPLPLDTPDVGPEPLGYRLKTALLGKPLTSDQVKHERLTKFLALGVLSSDCISSSAYGSEEMLLILLPAFAVAGFAMLLPLTFVILTVLVIVTLTYRDVVTIYTKTGGSYVVARENFGPLVAQVAAVALMLDYIVTVAVQSAAGTYALASAFYGTPWFDILQSYQLEITVLVVLILFYGNLRGIREAGRTFALPTYLFAGSISLVIVVGLVREVLGDLPTYPLDQAGGIGFGDGTKYVGWVALFYLLRAFANGGSSLTGLEAISNGVSVFHKPEGLNARKTLVVMSCILGFLVAGISWLAFETKAQPFSAGTPTVISQVATVVLGDSWFGHAGFLFVQVATMLILWTGANTPFNGFPFLASFVAEDQFLPRQLRRRGHRLAFSNGIIVLTIAALALLIGTGAHVDALVAFYAIGVFTGFTLAGFGMARYFSKHPATRNRRKVVLNSLTGVVSALVVVIFAVVKFTEGAWLVLVLFPVGVWALFRLNRQYRMEAETLRAGSPGSPSLGKTSKIARHNVVVLVDNADLATVAAIRYALSLEAASVRAVHFVLDEAHADELLLAWSQQSTLTHVPLDFVACKDRRLTKAVLEMAARETTDPSTELTLLLPRRTYARFLGRILHDHTADDIARTISQMPRVYATVIPFDVEGLIERRKANIAAHEQAQSEAGSLRRLEPYSPAPAAPVSWDRADEEAVLHGEQPREARPIADVSWRQRATISGEVRAVRVAALADSPSLEVELWDESGGVTLLFYGRRSIPGIHTGTRMTAVGTVGERDGRLAIANPVYRLEAPALD